MQIVRDGQRRDLIDALKIPQRFFEELQRLQIFHIADVLAHHRVPAFGQTKRVLQLRPGRQHFAHLMAQSDRVAARIRAPAAARAARFK